MYLIHIKIECADGKNNQSQLTLLLFAIKDNNDDMLSNYFRS